MLRHLRVFAAFLCILFLAVILLSGCQEERQDNPDSIPIPGEETTYSNQKGKPAPPEAKSPKKKKTASLSKAASQSIPKKEEASPDPCSGQKPPPETVLTPSEEKETEEEQYVLFSITGDTDKGIIFPPTEVPITEEDTVLSLLIRLTKEKRKPLDYRGTGAIAYVEGIDNLYEFDRGPQSGWLYRVNGEIPSVSAGDFKVQAGDTVEYIYTLDLGKDAGAPLS